MGKVKRITISTTLTFNDFNDFNEKNMSTNRTIINEAISASAGTGKTYALAVRYIRLLSSGVPPESVAAMTFTRKAAGEILDRIIVLICEWIENRERFEDEKQKNDYTELEYDRLPKLLYELLMNIHKLRISTLDSFYVSIIKAFPFEFGLNGDFQIVDVSAEEEAKLSVMREILWHETEESKKQAFLDDFKQATYGNEEKSILKNMKRFIDDHHEAFMQAGEEHIWGNPELIWPDNKEIYSCDIDIKEAVENFRNELAKTEYTAKQLEMWNAFLDETENLNSLFRLQSKNAKDTLKKLLESYNDIRNGSASFPLGGKRIEFDAKKCELVEPVIKYIFKHTILHLQKQTCGMFQILARYEKAYDNIIRRNGLFTFKDVLHQLSLHSIDDRFPVLSNNPDRSVDKLYIDYRLDSRFDHWLLDEFQDTNFLQWKVIENLIDEVMQDVSGERSFFYVGDIKQSIYQWRSGDPRLFNAVYERFASNYHNIEKKPLRKSYRSHSEITDTVNQVFSGLKTNSLLNETITDEVIARMEWEEHISFKGEGGYASLIGSDPVQGESAEDATIRKAEIIAEKIAEATPLERGMSVAILVRQHKNSAVYAQELNRKGIKTTISSQSSICDNPLVTAFLSLVMLAEHPQDEFAWQHLQMTPFSKVIDQRNIISLELLEDIFNHGYRFFIEKWLDILTEKTGLKIGHFYHQKLKEFLVAADVFDDGVLSAPHDFIEFIKSYKVNLSTAGDSVQIMTIHAAKGLGFDMVFLPELKGNSGIDTSDVTGLQVKKNERRCPEWAYLMPSKDIAKNLPVMSDFIKEKDQDGCYENLCLLYVAMTRAAKGLYMIIDNKESSTVYSSTILRETLAGEINKENVLDSNSGQPLYVKGKTNWYEATPLKEKAATAEQPVKLKIDFKDSLKRRTPSGSEPYITYGENLFTGATTGAMNLGTAVHELFEFLSWADIDDYDEVLQKWQATVEYPTEMIQTASDMFISALNSPDVFASLSRPSPQSELWREQDFSVVLDGEWISGSFDRVVINKDANGKVIDAVIMDYKTDQAENDQEIKAKAAVYAHQLQLYSKVLSFILKINEAKIAKKLVFVRPGRTVML